MLLPRLAHNVTRPRIAMWLARNERTPLRFLVAPAGCGKTNAIVSYLRARGLPYAYAYATATTTTAALFREISGSLGIEEPAGDFESLLGVLKRCGDVLVAIENIDALDDEERGWLARLVEQAPDTTQLIYASRTWDAIDIQRMAPQGLAAVCDDRMLAFNADEIAMLADHLGVQYTLEDTRRLADESEGWAIVAAAAVRDAAERGASLARSYDHWQERHGYLFRRFLDAAVAVSPHGNVWEVLCSGVPQSQPELEQMRRAGIFVRHDAHGHHYAYRVVERITSGGDAATVVVTPMQTPPLVARVLGEFRTEIGGEPIRWIRRRDQQIFLYLLLKEDGSASRAELCARFWPDAEPELRAASLRVACSNIRRAIGTIAGHSRVDRYFRSDGDIALNFANVSVDARRFRVHAAEGDEQFAQGNHAEALGHYRLAEKLYSGRIGWCANVDPWAQDQADIHEAMYLNVLDKLVTLHRRAEDAEHIFEYAQKAATAKFGRREALEEPAAC
ncbi:MAG: BTAD domain-containing putative transcriptional regulator [Candidatus Baltobacteraceae bacterium]